jgi:hypothetical protein
MRRVTLVVSLLALVVALAGDGCGSSAPGGDGGAGSGGPGGGGAGAGGSGTAGAVTFSCTVAGSLCTELLVPPSGVAAENQQCTTLQNGTSGTGCPTAGLVGCCLPSASDPSHQETCYYDASSATLDMQLCGAMTGHSWSTTM